MDAEKKSTRKMGPLSTLKKIPAQLLLAFLRGFTILFPIGAIFAFVALIAGYIDDFFEGILKFFIPQPHMFPLIGLTAGITLAVLLGIWLKSPLAFILDWVALRLPVIKHIWEIRTGRGILEAAIPVVVTLHTNVRVFGFLMGTTIIEEEVNPGEFQEVVCDIVYAPTSPVPVSGAPPLLVDPQSVRELELIESPRRRNLSRIKIFHITSAFGSSTPARIRAKIIDRKSLPLRQLTSADIIRLTAELDRVVRLLKGLKIT